MRRALTTFVLTLVLTVTAAGSALADRVPVRGSDHGDYAQLVFGWRQPVEYSAEIKGRRLIVRFGRPIEASYRAAVRALNKYVTGARAGSDGRSVVFNLTGAFEIGYYDQGSSVIVELVGKPPEKAAPKPEPEPKKEPAPAAAAEAPAPASAPAAPPAGTEDLPELRVRVGEHADYTRIVFDWPRAVDYGVAETGDAVTVIFARGARPNLRAFAAKPPRLVKKAGWEMKGKRLAVTFDSDLGVRVKHFLSGAKVVVDLRPPTRASIAQAEAKVAQRKTQAQALEAPGAPGAAPEGAPAPEAKVAEAVVEEGKPTPLEPQPPAPAPAAAAPGPAAPPPAPPPPPAPITPVTQQALSGVVPEVSLRFDWDEPVAAAVFRRAGALWVVFDKAVELDPAILQQAAGASVHRVEQVPSDEGTVLRFITNGGINPALRRDGLAWILDLARQPIVPGTAIEAKAQPDSPIGARIFLPVPEPGKAIAVVDPEVGNNLVIIPVIPLGHGVRETYIYPQVRVLPTAQGVVIEPRIDALRVRPQRQGVEMTSTDSLYISPVTAQAEASTKLVGSAELTRLFDLEKWRRGTVDTFSQFRQNFLHAVADAPDPQSKEERRLDLARFFFSAGYAPETLGVLRVVGSTRPEIEEDPAFIGMRGASNFVLARYGEASETLAAEALDGNDEATFWRAAVVAASGALAEAAPELKRTSGIIKPYPKALKVPLGLLVAEASVEAGDIKHSGQMLEVIKLEDLSRLEKADYDYVEGRLKELGGDFDGAVATWEKAMKSDNRPARAKAAIARAELLYKLEKISRAEIIEELEKLRFAWRGDDFEFNLLRRMGSLYLEESGFREGLSTLRQAATHFRSHEAAPEITQQMADTFAQLYLDGGADVLPPVMAIAIYDEFKELTPAGARGDEMIRKLADRLVGVDLLDRAAMLLESQVNFRLRGEEQSRVGARLALVYLLDRKPEKAMGALKVSDNRGLPKELVDQRRHIQTRAMMQLDQYGDALALLKGDKTLDGELLRTDIFWQTADWPNASQTLRRLTRAYGAKAGEALDDQQARLVLNLATALTLAGNERSIARLRRDYGPSMDQTPFREAFRLIASPPDMDIIEYSSIAGRVAEAERFRGFMSTYRERLKDAGLSAIN